MSVADGSFRSRKYQGRASNPSPKPASEIGTPIPSSGVWKMMNIACLPLRSCWMRRVVHQHFRNAAVRQAANEAGCAHVGVVDPEAEPARQQHPERSQNAQDARLLVGGFHDHYREADVFAVLRRHELHDDALLIFRSRRSIAAKIPVAVLRLHLALRESLDGNEKQQDEQEGEAMHDGASGRGRPFCDEMPVKVPRSPSRAGQRVKKEAEARRLPAASARIMPHKSPTVARCLSPPTVVTPARCGCADRAPESPPAALDAQSGVMDPWPLRRD